MEGRQLHISHTWRVPEMVAGATFAAAISIAALKAPGLERAILGLADLALLLFMAVQDVYTHRVPNRLVLPATAIALAGSLTIGPGAAVQAALGATVAFLILFLVWLVGKGAMGTGDVKVGCFCGAIVGLRGVPSLLFMTFAAGAVFALLFMALQLRKRRDVVPLVPFLACATVLSMSYFQLYLWG